MPTSEFEASDVMRSEFAGMRTQYAPKDSYKQRLKKAIEEGLLLFVKYILVVALLYVTLNFATGIISGSQNGTTSALYLNQLIEKGYLPKAVNGTIPDKSAMTKE